MGRFLSPLNGIERETLSARVLKPGSGNKSYNIDEVLKPLEVKGGIAKPWFGYSGGAVQYQTEESILILIKKGYLKMVN